MWLLLAIVTIGVAACGISAAPQGAGTSWQHRPVTDDGANGALGDRVTGDGGFRRVRRRAGEPEHKVHRGQARLP